MGVGLLARDVCGDIQPRIEDSFRATFIPTTKSSNIDCKSMDAFACWAIHSLPDFSSASQTF
jgi:hypothetical protein